MKGPHVLMLMSGSVMIRGCGSRESAHPFLLAWRAWHGERRTVGQPTGGFHWAKGQDEWGPGGLKILFARGRSRFRDWPLKQEHFPEMGKVQGRGQGRGGGVPICWLTA
eukprot:9504104-Pyramimonas_sp.AAC.2